MPAIISFRIFLLCNLLNSILLYFVPKKLLPFLPDSWFSQLPNTETTTPPDQPELPLEKTTSTAEKRMDPAELKRVFEMFDRNGDGRISQKELSESLGNLGISIPEEELTTMIQRIDVDNDGCVDLYEFEGLYRSIMVEKEDEDEMKEVFNVFDQNGDGYITFDELNSVMELLKQGKTIDDCKVMIRKVDADGDGRVDYKEFMQMMKGGGFMASN